MPEQRDTRADRAARRVLRAAIDGGAARRPAEIWVSSPADQFRRLDRGGRTVNERTITRAIYHQTSAEPRRWSAKLTWGKIEKRGVRWGRVLRLRVFRYSSGLRHSETHPQTSYVQREELRTYPGRRIDQ